MKKSIILGGSILCLFILVSLSYQPIVADMPIETIPMAKKSKASNLDVDELKELYNKLIEMKSQSDCGCGNKVFIGWHPILCLLLSPIWIIIATITEIITPIMNPPLLYFVIARIGTELGCWWG